LLMDTRNTLRLECIAGPVPGSTGARGGRLSYWTGRSCRWSCDEASGCRGAGSRRPL